MGRKTRRKPAAYDAFVEAMMTATLPGVGTGSPEFYLLRAGTVERPRARR